MMDNYKKKSARFSGLGRNVRAAELEAARRSSRLQRFSLLRPIDDDVPIEEPKESIPTSKIPTTKIPTFGSQKPSRLEMLKKWKEEKNFKKKAELESKKPPFKVGFVPLKFEPSATSFQKHNSFSDSSRTRDIDKKSITVRSNAATAGSQTTKTKVDVDKKFTTVRSNAATAGSQTTKTKVEISKPSVPRSNSNTKYQVANTKLQATKKVGSTVSSNTKISKVAGADTNGSKKIPHNAVPKQTSQKPAIPSLLPPRKQILNTKPKPQTLTSQPNTQASTRPKGSTFVKGANIKTTAQLKGPLENRPNPQKQPSKFSKPPCKNNNPTIKTAKPVEAKQPVPGFRKPAVKPAPPKVQPKKAKDNPELKTQNTGSPSQPKAEKSFAPMGFLFCPPTGLEASWFMDDGPCSIFEKVKSEIEGKIRTSTPKKSEWGDILDIKSSSSDLKPSFTVDSTILATSMTACINDILSHTNCLPANSAEFKLLAPTSLKNEVLEQDQARKNLPLGEIKQSETLTLEKVHLQNSLDSDMLETKKPFVASPITKDSQILPAEKDPGQARICQETPPKICSPLSNETKILPSGFCSPKDIVTKTADLEVDQENTASETFLVEKEPEKNSAPLLEDLVEHPISELSLSKKKEKETAPELLLPEENQENTPVQCQTDQSEINSESCSQVMKEAIGASGGSTDACSKSEKEETPLSSVFRPSLSFLNGTEKTKRFTRSHRRMEPSLLQISESPELGETPKSQKKKGNPDVPLRRSRRLARLSAFNSDENLFDITPSFHSPSIESSRLTYDFEKLHLESEAATDQSSNFGSSQSRSAHGKVSLLYTPPRTRKSTRIKSIGGDLMSFSPNVN